MPTDHNGPHNVMSVLLACVILHNIIQTPYRADHQGLEDEDNNHRQMPSAWMQVQVLPDLGQPQRWNQATIVAKRLRERVLDALLQQSCWGSAMAE